MRQFSSIEQLNAALEQRGFKLNQAGGAVKGTPSCGLAQSSTLAAPGVVQFVEGPHTIPTCYVEAAMRFSTSNPEPVAVADGDQQVFDGLYQGFVETSADKIFESTNVTAQPSARG
eukprot:GHVT01057568.1.p1 GENE.GHVT01057568.1~~GHVT01057568.1.p1  ORF type:complete len:116 (-),score=24.41 GHVT01057568.1:936-1283(-)